jgi:hypothetical protein
VVGGRGHAAVRAPAAHGRVPTPVLQMDGLYPHCRPPPRRRWTLDSHAARVILRMAPRRRPLPPALAPRPCRRSFGRSHILVSCTPLQPAAAPPALDSGLVSGRPTRARAGAIHGVRRPSPKGSSAAASAPPAHGQRWTTARHRTCGQPAVGVAVVLGPCPPAAVEADVCAPIALQCRRWTPPEPRQRRHCNCGGVSGRLHPSVAGRWPPGSPFWRAACARQWPGMWRPVCRPYRPEVSDRRLRHAEGHATGPWTQQARWCSTRRGPRSRAPGAVARGVTRRQPRAETSGRARQCYAAHTTESSSPRWRAATGCSRHMLGC